MKKNFKKSIRNALALILCVVTVLLGLCSCSSEKKDGKETEADSAAVQNNAAAEENAAVGTGKEISIADYVTVNYYSISSGVETVYSGYSGASDVNTDVDYQKLGEDIGKEGLKKYYTEIHGASEEEAEYFLSSINSTTVTIAFKLKLKETYSFLKNGDKITVTVVPTNENVTVEEIADVMGISIQAEADITVEGLEEGLKEIDILNGVEKYIKYSGANGTGRAKFDYSSVTEAIVFEDAVYFQPSTFKFDVVYINENLGYIGFSFDKDSELSKGDVLTVKIGRDLTIDKLVEKGFIPKDFTREITVPDLGEYVTSKEQLTAEDIEKIKQDVFAGIANSTNPQINAAYFATIKPGVACNLNEKTELHFACKVDTLIGPNYFCCRVKGVAKTEAGELKYEEIDNYKYDGAAEDIASALDSSYTYEKLF